MKDIRDSYDSKEAGKPSLQRVETEDTLVNIETLYHSENYLVRTLPLFTTTSATLVNFYVLAAFMKNVNS